MRDLHYPFCYFVYCLVNILLSFFLFCLPFGSIFLCLFLLSLVFAFSSYLSIILMSLSSWETYLISDMHQVSSRQYSKEIFIKKIFASKEKIFLCLPKNTQYLKKPFFHPKKNLCSPKDKQLFTYAFLKKWIF